MKKLYFAICLLLISLIYVISRVTKDTLYLSDMSVRADNPVSLTLNSISIDSGFVEPTIPESIYHIWMTPVYILVLIALGLTIYTFTTKKRNG
ncbi:hypothetical protein [Alkalicoccobacillus murimartini]|uniref:Uncharacterized protein n=1 Tax=Alkalicoccobacillus murimartini TaxID=171685 RepID=A0ABT9YE74_9BACI|nr:hypothetical protein [Alkalicoccobacillus murimartini]MDQ0206151.1 hypothetical protein [Alkalicoccobacillus murimartini]